MSYLSVNYSSLSVISGLSFPVSGFLHEVYFSFTVSLVGPSRPGLLPPLLVGPTTACCTHPGVTAADSEVGHTDNGNEELGETTKRFRK